LNQQGRLAVLPQWDQVFDFHEELASVKVYEAYSHRSHAGFINTNGQIVIPLQWDGAVSFSEGMAAVTTNYLWGFIDKGGKVVIPPQWDSMQVQSKWGLINQFGKVICTPKWDFVEPPRDGLLKVRDGNKWMLMRVEGN
jgi:exopolysaccharide biosynthesis protein